MRPAGGGPTPLLRVYRGLTGLLAPVAYRITARKLRQHGVDEARIAERQGYATRPRPDGTLIWFHAASVGESLSVLTLIGRLGVRLPHASFLITSGTATSADLIARRLPPRTCHQFAALDTPAAVRRFLEHWVPQAGVFVESELWPNILMQARARGTKLALLNARLSAKSVQGWQRWPDTARQVLSGFSVMLTQNRQSADNLVAMGADPARVRPGVNLKATSDPLPVDEETLLMLRAALNGRPIWVASSTHPGEEEVVAEAHRKLLSAHPSLLLLLVPRHPERGEAVASLLAEAGLRTARRSTGGTLTNDTQVYLADTLGETGTWYALSPIVFLGGSLLPIGGHNPFEPAQAGAAVLTGPNVANFSETFAPLVSLGGAIETPDANALALAVGQWLEHADTLETARKAAGRFAETQQAALADVIDTLCAALELDRA